ncbi:hypothetical protein PSAC2689_210046 [Paraburkholderia sacchari]
MKETCAIRLVKAAYQLHLTYGQSSSAGVHICLIHRIKTPEVFTTNNTQDAKSINSIKPMSPHRRPCVKSLPAAK